MQDKRPDIYFAEKLLIVLCSLNIDIRARETINRRCVERHDK